MRMRRRRAILLILWCIYLGSTAYGATDSLSAAPLGGSKGDSINRPTPICVASSYLLYDLGDLGGGNLWVNHISNSGIIVGSSKDTNGTTRPCVWEFKDNEFTIEAIGSSSGSASGMNEADEIVGSVASGYGSLACSWSRTAADTNWSAVSYAGLGGPYSGLAGMNNERVAVGWANNSQPALRAAIWIDGGLLDLGSGEACAINEQNGVVGFHYMYGPKRACCWELVADIAERTDLPLLSGATSSEALSINSAGEMVGNQSFTNAYNSRACLWSSTNGMYEAHELESFGGTNSKAYDINTRGQIAGYGQDASGTYCAAIWEQGTAVNLNHLLPDHCEWELILAASINDQGAIVGRASVHGVYKSFLLSPHALIQSDIQHLLGQASLSWPALGTSFSYGIECLDPEEALWQTVLIDGSAYVTNNSCLIPMVDGASNRWFRLNVHNHDE